MGRTPIRARDSPGFIANRLARPFSLESLRMLGDGVADAATIDRAYRLGGGFRMGPFELIDLIGLDVNLSVARSFYQQGGEPERWQPSPIQDGWSAKAGSGARAARATTTTGGPTAARSRPRHRGADLDPERLAQIAPAAPAILPRLFAQIANEAAFALKRGSARPRTWTRRCGSALTGRSARSVQRLDRRLPSRRPARTACGRSAAMPIAVAPRLRAEAEGESA